MAAIAVGHQAPDFTLPTADGGTLSLHDLLPQGKVVLAFYTEDNTPLCSRELSTFAADYELFRETGAQVVAISVDSVDVHCAFAEQEGGFPFPLASDAGRNVARAYGVLDEDSKRAHRAVFVIDRDGAVLHANPFYNPANLDQFQAIFRALGLAV